MKIQKHKTFLTVLAVVLVGIGLQVAFATVPNPGHLLSELECNSLFCINSTNGTVTIGGTASIPLIVNGRITSTGTPTVATDVATKGYVDNAVGGGGGTTVVEITSSGQWTVPTNVHFINTILIGGGGGGGQGSSANGGGGGGSGQIESVSLTVTPNESLYVVVGAGGGSASCGGSTYLSKSDGRILAWANSGCAGGGAGSYGGKPGSGRCAGGAGQIYCPGCPSCNGQCSGGGCGLSQNSSGEGGCGYGAGGGGGGSGTYGNRAGGGGGGYYGATTGYPCASAGSVYSGSPTAGGTGAPGIIIISY